MPTGKIDLWKHHSHPLSGWTRSLSQPLLCLPLWNRSWKQGVALAIWLVANPILFPPPRHNRAWMTRAILGEQIWVADLRQSVRAGTNPLGDRALWPGIAQSVLLLASLYAAWRRRLLPMSVLNVGALLCNLWYLDFMARLYDRSDRSCPGE